MASNVWSWHYILLSNFLDNTILRLLQGLWYELNTFDVFCCDRNLCVFIFPFKTWRQAQSAIKYFNHIFMLLSLIITLIFKWQKFNCPPRVHCLTSSLLPPQHRPGISKLNNVQRYAIIIEVFEEMSYWTAFMVNTAF